MSNFTARWWKSVCKKITHRNDYRARRKVRFAVDLVDSELLESRALMSAVACVAPLQHTAVTSEATPPATTSHQQSMEPAGSHSAITFSSIQAPSAMSMSATAASSTQVNLKWSASNGATGYQIDEYTSAGWVKIATEGAGVTSFSVPKLTPKTGYYFDVGGYNSAGAAWAPYQYVTTSSAPVTIVPDHPAAAIAYSPVSGSLFGANGPKFTDVQQGDEGDCWLLSSLAAVAARYPADITSMFSSAGTTVENGATVSLYNVRLYDTSGKAENILVDTELPGGGTYYDTGNNGVLWVALAEKAYAEANGKGYVTTQYNDQDSYNALNGGSPSWALHAIMDQAPVTASTMAAAWNSGDVICLGSSTAANNNLIVGGSEGTHAYAVVGYNPSSSYPFELYNPWGASTTVNGVISYDGGSVYGGAFWASASLISHDFASESFAQVVFADNKDAGDSDA